MKYMYVVYNSNKRKSVIKENDNIKHELIELSQTSTKESSESLTDNFNSYKVIDFKDYVNNKNDNINDEITKFFFESIHKNHLKNR